MTVRIPYKLWAKAKCAETGKSELSLRRRLKKRDFNGYRPIFGGTNLKAVEIKCNDAGRMHWLDVKMSDKLKRRECACGKPGISRGSDNSWSCGECQIKEAKYGRCLTSIAARRERNKWEDEIENETKRLRLVAPIWD